VQGERKAKSKAKICFLALPNRSLFYPKIVQGERKAKSKAKICFLALSNRSLFYQKIMQGVESWRTERKHFLTAGAAMRMPTLS